MTGLFQSCCVRSLEYLTQDINLLSLSSKIQRKYLHSHGNVHLSFLTSFSPWLFYGTVRYIETKWSIMTIRLCDWMRRP